MKLIPYLRNCCETIRTFLKIEDTYIIVQSRCIKLIKDLMSSLKTASPILDVKKELTVFKSFKVKAVTIIEDRQF